MPDSPGGNDLANAPAEGAAPQLGLFGDEEALAPSAAPVGIAQTIYVHFEDVEGLRAFADLIGQPISTNTQRICYPPDALFEGRQYVGSAEPKAAPQTPCIYDEARSVGGDLTRSPSTPAGRSEIASGPTGEAKRTGEHLVPAQSSGAAPGPELEFEPEFVLDPAVRASVAAILGDRAMLAQTLSLSIADEVIAAVLGGMKLREPS